MPYPVAITGPRVALRELTADDADALQVVYGDPVTTEHLSFEPRTLDQVEGTIARAQEVASATPRVEYMLAVCLGNAKGPLIGAGRLALGQPDTRGPYAGLDPQAESAQFGLAIHAGHWGHGYGREALGLLLDFAFGTLGVASVWGARSPVNAASKALMDSAGFAETHTIHNHITKNGKPRDSVIHEVARPAER